MNMQRYLQLYDCWEAGKGRSSFRRRVTAATKRDKTAATGLIGKMPGGKPTVSPPKPTKKD